MKIRYNGRSLAILSLVVGFLTASCTNPPASTSGNNLADTARIVSVNGTTTEILAALNLADKLVGVDVASTYPEAVASLPRVGHSRQIAAEGILALSPTLVIGTTADVKPELTAQLQQAGVKTLLFDQTFTTEGTRNLIRSVADSLGSSARGDSLITALDADLEKAKEPIKAGHQPRVLFIYARGAGTMMVAGDGTPLQQIIELAGGQNAVTGFPDYKPLTAEALVAANPDVILLFDSGLQSLGGEEGLLNVQGIKETNAGKNRKIVQMDGQLLTGFSPRLGLAVAELASKIHE